MASRPLQPEGNDGGEDTRVGEEGDGEVAEEEEEEGGDGDGVEGVGNEEGTEEDEGEEEEADGSEEEEEERVVKRKIVIVVSFGGRGEEEEDRGRSPSPGPFCPAEPRHEVEIGCQVDGCDADLGEAKRYHRRHKVCESHAKAAVARVDSIDKRFCQQCSRFHVLSKFDGAKRSCRNRLAGHNERRRKVPPDLKADTKKQQVAVP